MSQIASDKCLVIGVYIDSALQGVDYSVVEIQHINKECDQWSKKLVDFQTCSYSEDLRTKILQTMKHYSSPECLSQKIPKESLDELDQEFTAVILDNLSQLKQQYNEVSLIGISGLLIQLAGSDQKQASILGNCGQQIANELKVKVICNFYAYDFFLKGNGGPFQIIGNAKLCENLKTNLILSGYASLVSFKNKDDPLTYSGQFICPAMFLIHYVTNWYTILLSQQGNVNQDFLKQLQSISCIFSTSVMNQFMKMIDESKLSTPDKLTTIIDYIVGQVTRILDEKQKDNDPLLQQVQISGQFSQELFNEITKRIGLDKCETLENHKQLDSIIIAFLALRKAKSLINFYRNVTSAKSDHSSGIVYIPSEKQLMMQKQIEQHPPKKAQQQLINSEDFNEFIPITDEPQKIKNVFQAQYSLKK